MISVDSSSYQWILDTITVVHIDGYSIYFILILFAHMHIAKVMKIIYNVCRCGHNYTAIRMLIDMQTNCPKLKKKIRYLSCICERTETVLLKTGSPKNHQKRYGLGFMSQRRSKNWIWPSITKPQMSTNSYGLGWEFLSISHRRRKLRKYWMERERERERIRKLERRRSRRN